MAMSTEAGGEGEGEGGGGEEKGATNSRKPLRLRAAKDAPRERGASCARRPAHPTSWGCVLARNVVRGRRRSAGRR